MISITFCQIGKTSLIPWKGRVAFPCSKPVIYLTCLQRVQLGGFQNRLVVSKTLLKTNLVESEIVGKEVMMEKENVDEGKAKFYSGGALGKRTTMVSSMLYKILGIFRIVRESKKGSRM
mmetsp:Transcript_19083/g.44315  ORF Transcript_19083/g.44315 Transcript_19083/m.44315 type:complete len:119 (+) Transcript_19083:936-1292(+)